MLLLLLLDNDLALLRLKCALMKMGSVMVEFKDLETHLNRIMGFTGSRVRISNTTSSERRWLDEDNNVGFFLVLDIV